jgi:hypothetical protein
MRRCAKAADDMSASGMKSGSQLLPHDTSAKRHEADLPPARGARAMRLVAWHTRAPAEATPLARAPHQAARSAVKRGAMRRTSSAASPTTSELGYGCVAAVSLAMTCCRSSGPTEMSPVNGRV